MGREEDKNKEEVFRAVSRLPERGEKGEGVEGRITGSEQRKESVRLQVYLSRAGLGSRRKCEELISRGRVAVNGVRVKKLGVKIDGFKDLVTVDGIFVEARQGCRYLILNKPAGYLCTLHDPRGRPTIHELIPDDPRLFPVGRLDLDSRGLLLVTDDGFLANRVMHPRFGVDKTYVVTVSGKVEPSALRRLREGIRLEEGITSPAKVRCKGRSGGLEILEITIHQGWKRQIRRMCRAVGLEVRDLVRTRLGPLTLRGLAEGSWRELTLEELDKLHEAVGL